LPLAARKGNQPAVAKFREWSHAWPIMAVKRALAGHSTGFVLGLALRNPSMAVFYCSFLFHSISFLEGFSK